MQNPVNTLYEEHGVIANAIDIGRQAGALLGKDEGRYEKILRELIIFLRDYADQFHHQKEEMILFPEMGKRNELLADGLIREMQENHEDFRGKIRQIEKFLNEKDFEAAQTELDSYCEALMDHIAVENDELFQIAEAILEPGDLEKMYFLFEDSDRELGLGRKRSLVEKIEALRKELVTA